MRFLAAMDEREEIKGPDYLQRISYGRSPEVSLKDPAMREWVIKNRIPPGMYEFMIARTAFFDHVVEQALLDTFPRSFSWEQAMNSRSYRFKEIIKGNPDLRVGYQPTQQRKMELLHQAGAFLYRINSHLFPLTSTPTTLETFCIGQDSIETKNLSSSGKGVTYYLSARLLMIL